MSQLSSSNTSAVLSSQSNHTLVKEVSGWLFNRKKYDDHPNMTVLPVLAMICFIICVLLRIYKWYKEGVRLEAVGDIEIGDESEVNYGIIKAGDKEFCNVEIRSDTTSVYDTVTSFRNIGNGHAIGGAPLSYHDTVTSYKSLLMQRLDGAQYDSVKSYKAFLRQVTQNTDLAVEVKLLENYPVRSKSAEHCVLEEESSGFNEAMKPFSVADVKVVPVESKKKIRHRRASGDILGAMRKRSASNPTYHTSRTGAASLPSIRQTLSSDSSNEDEPFVTLASDRRKLWEMRKKMARSCSGSKLAKPSLLQNGEGACEMIYFNTRRRHFSADSARRPRKALGSICHRAELNDLRESISETDPRSEEVSLLKKQDDSSSENPDSSPSSCNTSVSSDAIESNSDDEDTQQITQVSVASDDYTVSGEGVFDSCGELASSAEHLLGPVNPSFSESVNGICNLPIDTSDEIAETNIALVSVTPSLPSNISKSKTHDCNGNMGMSNEDTEGVPGPTTAASDNDNHSTSPDSSEVCIIQTNTEHNLPLSPSSSSPIPINNSNSTVHNNSSPSPNISPSMKSVDQQMSQNSESPDLANPRRVKRFHVTFVSSDMSSPNSD